MGNFEDEIMSGSSLLAVRFFASGDADEIVVGISKLYEALRRQIGEIDDERIRLCFPRADDSPTTKVLDVNRLRDGIAGGTLRKVVWQADNRHRREVWNIIPSLNKLRFFRLQFDRVFSSNEKRNELFMRLKKIVDSDLLDIALTEDGYYGRPSLIHLYHVLCEEEREMVSMGAAITPNELRAGRNEPVEFVPVRKLKSWIEQRVLDSRKSTI